MRINKNKVCLRSSTPWQVIWVTVLQKVLNIYIICIYPKLQERLKFAGRHTQMNIPLHHLILGHRNHRNIDKELFFLFFKQMVHHRYCRMVNIAPIPFHKKKQLKVTYMYIKTFFLLLCTLSMIHIPSMNVHYYSLIVSMSEPTHRE